MLGNLGCVGPCRPLRGLARSHRYSTDFKYCAVLVGAGKPAKRPAQEYSGYRTLQHHRLVLYIFSHSPYRY
ncbi:hypothetical protein EGJ22_13360 [Pseudomonas sp. p99-361]|nr:hypothetical protein HV87_18065 [Pseudomonas aeruginosa]QEQ87885.1 hypothetical protein F1602_11345 [Pseudomonas putida]RRV18494.1 hypothetical protein EGJ22_13360 [Pseudomonas sp. p99-361]